MYKSKATVPMGVLLISSFYAFGAVVLLAFLLINPTQASSMIAERHGLPASTGPWILPVVAGIGFLIPYGLVSLSRWGYGLTILYLIYFGSVNWFLLSTRSDLFNFGNLAWAFLVILYLIVVRKRFFVKHPVRDTRQKAQTI
jgi:hypothetical protein